MSSRRLPPLNALRAFEAAARRKSISRAAEELGVTHGAISHQLRALEAFLGTDLLERAGNRFKLTLTGEQLLGPLSSGFDMLMSALISLETPSVRGDVTLSAPPALTCLWIAPNLGQLLQRHPELRLHLRPSNSPKEVIASDVDLCIRYGDGIWPGRRCERLADPDLFPVCSPAVFDGEMRALAEMPLLCAANGHEWDLWQAAVPQGSILMGGRHFMGNHLAMIEAAVAGVGLAMGDDITCRRYLASGELVRPFKESARAPAAFFLIDAGDHERRPAVMAVRRWMLESFLNNTTS